jgi:lipopolysaccharide transport system ATP-binding protein
MAPAISVRGLGKRYRLGERLPYRTLRDSLARVARFALPGAPAADQTTLWALRDVSFAVEAGTTLGIVGRNGAGKSTLLKILARVTDPTEGEARLRGRVASLLEVGTGFHPELTGKENVFLNGAILGMTRREVRGAIDSIVAFAGIEPFVDTPVKRYSSGMYVRLAFAVAAHLETEILLVDEVLAVGDVEFQKKCLSRMRDLSVSGRTVLFVSHNMGAVNALCTEGVFLDRGGVAFRGSASDTVRRYLERRVRSFGTADFSAPEAALERYGTRRHGELLRLATSREGGGVTDTFEFGRDFGATLTVRFARRVANPEVGICITTPGGARLHHFLSTWELEPREYEAGDHAFDVRVPRLTLYPGTYTLAAWVRHAPHEDADDFVESALEFTVLPSPDAGGPRDFANVARSGGSYVKSAWTAHPA